MTFNCRVEVLSCFGKIDLIVYKQLVSQQVIHLKLNGSNDFLWNRDKETFQPMNG